MADGSKTLSLKTKSFFVGMWIVQCYNKMAQNALDKEVSDLFDSISKELQEHILWVCQRRGMAQGKNMLVAYLPIGVGPALDVPDREAILNKAAERFLSVRLA